MMVLWPTYKRFTFQKYLEDKWLTPVVYRKSANCAKQVLGFLRSVGNISSIITLLVMHLQWFLHDALKTLLAKAAFTKGFNSSQAKDWWSTTSLNATGDICQDLALICAILTKDPSHPAWCHPLSLLPPPPRRIRWKGGLTPAMNAWVATPSNGTPHGASPIQKW
jgi:hypothetical protein